MHDEVLNEPITLEQQIDSLNRILGWYTSHQQVCKGEVPAEDQEIRMHILCVLENCMQQYSTKSIEEVIHEEKD